MRGYYCPTPQGDMYEYLPVERRGERIAGLGEDFLLLGHTHVQGIRSFGDVTVVNPGRVGLARDGGGEACYAVHEDGRLELKRIPYDVHRTVGALRSSPLPSEVVQGLESVLRPGAKVGSR